MQAYVTFCKKTCDLEVLVCLRVHSPYDMFWSMTNNLLTKIGFLYRITTFKKTYMHNGSITTITTMRVASLLKSKIVVG